MPALHAPATPSALAHVHAKGAGHDPRDGQFFFVLCRDKRQADGAGTLRTARRQRGVVGFIDSSWPSSVRFDTILRPAFRPERRGWPASGFANGAACRCAARRASSNCRIRRSLSRRSRSRSRSTRSSCGASDLVRAPHARRAHKARRASASAGPRRLRPASARDSYGRTPNIVQVQTFV
jgi:hypothetical protein